MIFPLCLHLSEGRVTCLERLVLNELHAHTAVFSLHCTLPFLILSGNPPVGLLIAFFIFLTLTV